MGPTYEVLPMDVGAANKGIMTDGDQCASFSEDGPPAIPPAISPARRTVKGLGEGQWAPFGIRCSGFLPPFPLILWRVLAWPLPPFYPFSFSDHLEANDLDSSCMIPFPRLQSWGGLKK